jgi:glycosyltransferase involved in cell wall biosynthesis
MEATAFERWLASPDPDDESTTISRYLRAVYEDRPDIAAHFPDLSGPGGTEYVDWMRMHGRGIAGALPEYVPAPVATSAPRPSDLDEGVNLVGYLRAEDGIGSVARSVFDVLRRADVRVSPRTCTATRSRQSADFEENLDDVRVTYDTTITCVNADQFPLLSQQLGGLLPVASHAIGVWAWEVEVFPEWMARSEVLVDEIWTYSHHAAAAIEAACTVPVHVFAPPVFVPSDIDAIDRAEVGITDDFTFLFCFDLASGFERKNPLAVVQAFCRAFAPGDGPRLLIKTVNGSSAPSAWARVQAAVEGRVDIEVRDGYQSSDRQRALMTAADCYVSLHRAEGYGLTLAEAMAVGRPVIGTGYSGNLEFMTDDTSVMVPFEMKRIPFGCPPYPPTALWAEPDIDEAAQAMRNMAADPASAARLGARARAHMTRRHTAAARVDFVRTRLQELRTNR